MNIGRIFSVVKVTIGIVLLIAAFLIARFGVTRWIRYGDTIQIIWVPVVSGIGFGILGLCLIARWATPIPKRQRLIFLGLLVGIPIIGVFLMGLELRHIRNSLASQARTCSSQSVPAVFKGDSEGGVGIRYVGPGKDGLEYAHSLIRLCANDGLTRASAKINGDMSIAFDEISCYERADAIKTNEQARAYLGNCKSILFDINRTAFWQSIEDAVDSKLTWVVAKR